MIEPTGVLRDGEKIIAKKSKTTRTNSMRLLEAQDIDYEVVTFPAKHFSALEVAQIVGAPPDQVHKTLVVLREGGKALLVMIAGDRQLDLKRLATSIGNPKAKLKVASQLQAEQITGLLVGGISALALLNQGFEICIDQDALAQEHVYVSAGQRGINLKLAAQDLIDVTQAQIVQAAR